MKRVCLDPGHGGIDAGAVYNGLKEKDIVLDICLLARDRLLRYGEYQVLMTRECDEYVSLMERSRIANNDPKSDIFLSVHCNADPDEDIPGMPEAEGEEIWYYEYSNAGFLLAQCIQDQVDRIFPNEPFRGIKGSRKLYVLKHTLMPACLIEIGFIDKSSSVESFTKLDTIEKIAELITEGITNYF